MVGEEVTEFLGTDHRSEGFLIWVRLGGWKVDVEEAGGVDVVFKEFEEFGMNGEDGVKVGGLLLIGEKEFEVED